MSTRLMVYIRHPGRESEKRIVELDNQRLDLDLNEYGVNVVLSDVEYDLALSDKEKLRSIVESYFLLLRVKNEILEIAERMK